MTTMPETNHTEPRWGSSALLTIDVQNDFALPGGVAEVQGTADILPALARLLEGFRAGGLPILHVVRLYRADGSNVDLCRRALVQGGRRIVVPGSHGSQLAESVRPGGCPPLDADLLFNGGVQALGEKEWAMYKPRWGAFYGTALEQFLRDRGIDTLVFGGCNFPNCPRTSLYEASERDFRLVLASDAMSRVYERGLEELEAIGVSVASSAEILTRLEPKKGEKSK